MRDLDLLKELLKNTDHPIQFLFAGKAHPADEAGKDLIRASTSSRRRNRLQVASLCWKTTTLKWAGGWCRESTSG